MDTKTEQKEPDSLLDMPIGEAWGYAQSTGLLILGIAGLGMLNKYVIQPRTGKLANRLASTLEQDRLVKNQLHQMLGITGGKRAVLLQPHNGTEFISGHAGFFMSITHEAVDPGIERLQHRMQSVPIGMFEQLLGDIPTCPDLPNSRIDIKRYIAECQLAKVYSQQNLHELDAFLSNAMLASGTDSMIAYPLITDKKHVLGLVVIGFVGEAHSPDSTMLKGLHKHVRTLMALMQSKKDGLLSKVLLYVSNKN